MFVSVSMAYNVPFSPPYILEPVYIDYFSKNPVTGAFTGRTQIWLQTKNPLNKFLINKQIKVRTTSELLMPSLIDTQFASIFPGGAIVVENKKILKIGKTFFPKMFSNPHILFEDLVKLSSGRTFEEWCKHCGYSPYKNMELSVLDYQRNSELFFSAEPAKNLKKVLETLGVTAPKPPKKTPEYVLTSSDSPDIF